MEAILGGIVAVLAAIGLIIGIATAPGDGSSDTPPAEETTPAPIQQEKPFYETTDEDNVIAVTWEITQCSEPVHKVVNDDAEGVDIEVGYTVVKADPNQACPTVMRDHTENIELSQPLSDREVNIVEKFTEI